MSSQPKRVVRPVKPKVQPVTPPAEVVEQAPVVLPEPAQVVAPVEPVKRAQTNKPVIVSISAARVRRHLDKLNINNIVDDLINGTKEALNNIKTAKTALETGVVEVTKDGVTTTRPLTAEEVTAYESLAKDVAAARALELKLQALSRERVRFSSEASLALAIVCDELVQQLVGHTMEKVVAAGKKIIQVSHLHESDVEKLSLYPLVKILPSFVATNKKYITKLTLAASESALQRAVAQAEKDIIKKYGIKGAKRSAARESAEKTDVTTNNVTAPVDTPVDAPADAHEHEDEDTDSKVSFKFYIGQICKEVVKQNPQYAQLRVSTEIRQYLSDLVVEFIQRLAALVELIATCMKNKTISDVAVMKAIEMILIDGHAPCETVEYKEAGLVPDPIALKAELAKKDEEEKAGREYKFDVDALPKVTGLAVVRTVKYPRCGFAELDATVQSKLKLLKNADELVDESA